MFCNQCGAPLAESAGFCGQCGKPAGMPPPAVPTANVARPAYVASATGRVERHRTVLAVLWLVLGGLGMIGGWVLLVVAQAQPWNYGGGYAPPFLSPLLTGVAYAVLVFSALRVVAATGLFALQGWARVLLIVLAIISIIDLPLGTALGVYTLWVLVPREAEVEYDALVRARAMRQPA